MITNIIILALIIWGVAALFEEGRLLGYYGKMLDEASPQVKWFFKPICLCPQCMASIYGTAAAYYLGYSIEQWLVLVFAVSGLNFLISEKW